MLGGAELDRVAAEVETLEGVEGGHELLARSGGAGAAEALEEHLGGDVGFELAPLLDDQELDSRGSTGAVYWEGAVRLVEAGRERGRGYLEMTGYGDRIRVG